MSSTAGLIHFYYEYWLQFSCALICENFIVIFYCIQTSLPIDQIIIIGYIVKMFF